MWQEEGLDIGDKRVIFYCGSGWRASLAWCVHQLLVKDDKCLVYDGSVMEWAVFSPRAASHALERGDGEVCFGSACSGDPSCCPQCALAATARPMARGIMASASQ